ncbi:MAG TPA: type II toxin-antitoxin system RelE/ParE family toxin [Rhizobiaceae bacterium]|nr:type II toxin-antitoxin system RelE/ParE family toxin [Rhizobiaceae bacterium]
MRLRFTRKALENLTEIAIYLNERNPNAAIRVREAIETSLGYLAEFPYAGRRQVTEGVRKFVTRKYHYIAYYAVNEATDELVVLSIKHPAQERDHEDA